MRDLFGLVWWAVVGLLRSRTTVAAENLVLRQQINVLRRIRSKRPCFSRIDRLIFVGLHRLFPHVRHAPAIVQPDTVIRWHRTGFRAYWRWKSRSRGGRPRVALEIRRLIREMSLANPLWGAPRIHGELLKLGIDIGQTSVAKYMARGRRPPSQGRRSFSAIMPTASRRWTSWWCHHFVPASLRPSHPTPWPAPHRMGGCHRASHRRMDCSTTHRGMRLGAGPTVPHPRSRPRIWHGGHAAPPDARHQRSTDLAALALAKCLCRTADRLCPSRVHRPCRRAWRTAPSPPAAVVQDLL